MVEKDTLELRKQLHGIVGDGIGHYLQGADATAFVTALIDGIDIAQARILGDKHIEDFSELNGHSTFKYNYNLKEALKKIIDDKDFHFNNEPHITRLDLYIAMKDVFNESTGQNQDLETFVSKTLRNSLIAPTKNLFDANVTFSRSNRYPIDEEALNKVYTGFINRMAPEKKPIMEPLEHGSNRLRPHRLTPPGKDDAGYENYVLQSKDMKQTKLYGGAPEVVETDKEYPHLKHIANTRIEEHEEVVAAVSKNQGKLF